VPFAGAPQADRKLAYQNKTAFECQIFGRAVLERRARIVAMVKRYCWDFRTGADTWNIKESKALAELLEL